MLCKILFNNFFLFQFKMKFTLVFFIVAFMAMSAFVFGKWFQIQKYTAGHSDIKANIPLFQTRLKLAKVTTKHALVPMVAKAIAAAECIVKRMIPHGEKAVATTILGNRHPRQPSNHLCWHGLDRTRI